MQEKNIETLVINKIESQAVYDAMEKAGKINSNELYLVGGSDGVTGVKGAKETTYRTGEVNLTAANIGALPEDTAIPSKTSDLTNDSDFATNSSVDGKLDGKVDKVTGKGLSTNDLTANLKANYNAAYTHSTSSHAPANAERNVIVGVKKNGTALTVDSSRSVDITVPTKVSELTNDSGFLTEHQDLTDYAKKSDLDSKVDKVNGKGLSTNDYTTAEKDKLSGIAEGANNYSLPVATSKALGGVKSGTDITVDASGNVSVNDNSHNHTIANVTGLQDVLDAKATTSYVDTKVAGIVDSAPEALDTLNELADALGNDPNFATTVATQIGSKVDKVTGKGLSTNDLTAALKSNYDAAYTHSTTAHAPSNAERNTIVGIQKNGTDVTINSSTRKVNIIVPTKVSELTNDSGYLTQHQDLSSYAKQSDLDSKVDKVNGKGLSTNDFTDTLESNLSTAYTHSQDAHAPSNAERNTIVTIKKNGTALTPDSSRAINVTVPTKVSELTNDSGYLTSVPVTSVNSKTGAVTLSASDVGAAPSSHTHNYLPLTGGTVTGTIVYPNAEDIYDTDGNVLGANFLLLDGSNQITKAKTNDGNFISAMGGATKKHTHEIEDVNGLDTAMLLKNVSVALPSGAWYDICYGEDRFVAVGDEVIAYSLDGFSWHLATSYLEQTRWNWVCYGNGKFVAIPDSPAMAIYSTDGITWTSVTLPFSPNNWYSLCCGGGKFVALAGNDKTAYSSDGITWTQGSMPDTSKWRAVCYGNGKFVAVNASNKAAYSTDGITWTATNIADTGAYYSIAYGEVNGQSMFVALQSNSGTWASSEDGITWYTESMHFGANYQIRALTFGGGVFVAQIEYEIGVGFAVLSFENSNWGTPSIYSTSGTSGTNLFCYGNGLFISGYDSKNLCLFSGNGIDWNDGTRKDIVYPDSKVVTSEVKEALQLSELQSELKAYARSQADSALESAQATAQSKYIPKTGGTLTGNLTGQYITGTWLQTTSAGDKAGNFATIDGDGWIYYRTPSEVVTDLDLPNNTTIRATTSVYGITRLSNSVTSSSKTLAATPYAVKTALTQAKEYVDEAITGAINSAY